MKSLFNHKLPIALFTVTALATAANAACERYKDCSFDVKKMRTWFMRRMYLH